MDKLNLDLNQFLRFLLAGAWSVACYFFIFPDQFQKLTKDHLVDLILIAMVLGSIVYVVYRAIIYPFILKFIYISLSVFKKMNWDTGYLIPFFSSKTEIEIDIKRWALRKNEKSKSKNIINWGSQVHFIFCSAFASLFIIIISKQIGGYNTQHLQLVKSFFWILLISGFIDNIRLILYDLKIIDIEKDLI